MDEKEVPYTFDPKHPYNWVRVRLFGGRSLFWARQSFRLSDYEFKAKDHDGFGDNWPIGLADLAPYYSRVEEIFRVSGHQDGLPQYPDGNFVEDNSPWSGSMQRFIAAGKKLGVPVCKPRSALGVDGLASSINLLLPDAFATGKLTAIPNVVVRELSVDTNTQPGERRAFRRSAFAAGDVGKGESSCSSGRDAWRARVCCSTPAWRIPAASWVTI